MKKKSSVKPGSKKKGAIAAIRKQAPPKPNPFETKKTAVRFETMGRKVRGATKNIVQAKQEGVTKRKKTLLVEYKSLRKANSFVDNRFGEQDENLTEEEKAIARFREQRLQQAKARAKMVSGSKSKFALAEGAEKGEEGDEGGLTHGGKALEDITEADLNEKLGLDDMDEEMAAELVRQYNFGGGPDAPPGADGKPKSKKEVMEEIIAKSKHYKAEKAKQKEADEDVQEQLDKDFRDLMQSQALHKMVKPTGYMKGHKVKPDDVVDAKYDEAARVLAFESKGAAGERTLSAEEEASRDRIRLERLEKERLRRMRGDGGDDEAELVPEQGSGGGFAARRSKQRARDEAAEVKAQRKQKRKGGDDDGSEDPNSGDDDGSDGSQGSDMDEGEDGEMDMKELADELDKRRKQRASEGHELNDAFRSQAAELLKKFGVKADNALVKKRKQMEGDGSEDEDEDGSDKFESGDEGEDGEDDEGEDDEGEDGSEDGDEGLDGTMMDSGSEGGENEEQGEEEGEDAEEEVVHAPREKAKAEAAAIAATRPQQPRQPLPMDGPMDLPFTIPMPKNYKGFVALVGGRSAEDLVTAVQRIRAFNAASLAADSKRGLQEFYGILVQHFALLAGELPVPIGHLDAMVPMLLAMTQEVPFYAATVARARLKKINSQLSTALGQQYGTSDPSTPSSSSTPTTSAFPAPRALLQLKLFATLFPASDRRHPVLTPTVVLIGRALSQCVAVDEVGVARGLFLASLALHLSAPAKRAFPEVITFLTDVISSFLPAPGGSKRAGKGAEKGSEMETSFKRVVPVLMAPSAKGAAVTKTAVGEVDLLASISGPTNLGEAPPDSHKMGLLRIALLSVKHTSALTAHLNAAPELMQVLYNVLTQVGAGLKLPKSLEELRCTVSGDIKSVQWEQTSSRKPLVSQAMTTRESRGLVTAAHKEFNPRFEEDFAPNRDYDPDRVKAETRKLKKQMRSEQRGAIRELRKDAAFMADTRDKERAVVDGERMDNQKRFYAELQAQAADIKSGGQAGMNPHLKNKKK